MGTVADAMDAFLAALAAGMRERGFKRRGRWFRRPRGEDAIEAVHVQGARRNRASRFFPDPDTAELFVNLYVTFPEIQRALGMRVTDPPTSSRWHTRLIPPERQGIHETWPITVDTAR